MFHAIAVVTALLVTAYLLARPVQRVMVRQERFRTEPFLALLVWQAVSLGAVLALLSVGPVAVLLMARGNGPLTHVVPIVLALTITGLLLVRLGYVGHTVGRSLRHTRRQHRDLVDLIGVRTDTGTTVLDHPTPSAYCVPGVQRRVVLTTGTLKALSPEELAAVLAHEQAHLSSRHDLLLEFFTVLHLAMPARWRHPEVLAEVALLVEVLADHRGARRAGHVPMAHALVELASGHHPQATLAAASTLATREVTIRIRLLGHQRQRRDYPRIGAMVLYAVAVVTTPLLLIATSTTWWASTR